MGKNKTTKVNIGCAPYTFLLGVPTAIVGHEIHGSIFWSIMDLIFWPIAWAKWLICEEVNMTIIKSAFDFFLQ